MSKPTTSELEILQLLWEKEPQTVKEINEAINLKKPTGYTTTLKILQIMTEKGFVEREVNGKKHLYYPKLKESNTQKAMIDKLLDSAFMGSAQKLIIRTLGNYKASKEEIKEIRQMLDKLDKKSK
ncbi:BlaI/MecI/CopY family transcriptional regulator [Bacteroidota bacterium]